MVSDLPPWDSWDGVCLETFSSISLVKCVQHITFPLKTVRPPVGCWFSSGKHNLKKKNIEIVCVLFSYDDNDKPWKSSRILRAKPKNLDIFEDFAFLESFFIFLHFSFLQFFISSAFFSFPFLSIFFIFPFFLFFLKKFEFFLSFYHKWLLTGLAGGLFLASMGGGAWPFLLGEVICLVNYCNDRDRQPAK